MKQRVNEIQQILAMASWAEQIRKILIKDLSFSPDRGARWRISWCASTTRSWCGSR